MSRQESNAIELAERAYALADAADADGEYTKGAYWRDHARKVLKLAGLA